MKKLILAFACALVAISASAQFKVEAGGNIGGYSKDSGFNESLGYFANALYDINIGDIDREHFFIETGIGFLANNIQDSDNSSLVNTSWIKVPVLIGSDYSIGGGYLTAAAGIYYGRGVSGKIENSGVSLDIMNNDIEEINIFKKNDFGLEGKAGYTLHMGLGFFLAYQYGLLNVAAQSHSEATTDVVSLGISYKFF